MMLKVHYPAHSYFKKQLTTYGSAELLMALDPILLKSALLHYLPGGEGNVGRVHDWGPEEGMSDDLNTPDHPPWSHNPNTNKLINDPQTGRPWGNHPVDYVHQDLQRKFNFSPEAAKQLINRSIDRYNRNGGQELPGFDDPRWRKVFYGPYIDEKTPARDRQIFGTDAAGMPGGMKPLITYSLPKGSVDHPAADQGRFIDGGHVHFHHELGEELREMMGQAGMSPAQIEQDLDLPYINDSTLKPNQLTRGPNGQSLVQSWGRQDLEGAIASGSIPANYRLQRVEDELREQRSHDDVHAHQLTSLLPDGFFHAPTGGLGGRGKTKDTMSVAGQKLAADMEKMGIDISPYAQQDENENITYPLLDTIANTKAMKMLRTRTHNIFGPGGGAVKSALKSTFASILPKGTVLDGLHETKEYRDQQSHAKAAAAADGSFADTANHRAADIVAMKNLAIHQLMQSNGISEDEARKEIVNRFRNHDYQADRHEPQEGLREETEKIVQAMMGYTGHKAYEMGPLATHRVSTGLPMGIGETQTQVPDYWTRRDLSSNLDSMVGAGPAQQQIAQQPTAEAPVSQFRPESGYSMGPGQVQFSSDNIMHGLDDIRKKMGYFDGFLRGF